MRRAYEPWAAYRAALIAETEATRRNGELVPLSDAEYDALLNALRTVRQDLVEARHSLDDEG
ncbi:MAG: hypothetical protein WBA97_16705 [Actinophytocola sp.]|uniref:hypothetical protein n=1 Tax=Actinophytocola sp. TaxID=1872138 RepID=UPI003C75AAF7